MTMRTRRVAVRGIIFSNDKLLVATFRQDDGSEGDYWGTFGGGLDIDEGLVAGLEREMIEETGIAAKVGKLLFIQQFNGRNRDHLEFFFHIKNPEDYDKINLEKTTHGSLELVRAAFVDPKTHSLKPTFLSKIDIKDYIENDRPVFLYKEVRKDID